MKKFNILLVALFAIAACTSEYDKMMNDASRAGKPGEDEFYATVEDTGSADPQTKVYADEQMRVLWNAGDTISIFKKTTLNRPYRFTGPEGSNAGGFTELPNSDEFITENPLNYNYAIYPYRKETVMSYDGVLTVDMPAVQVYKEHSFGMGANTMVSVTEDNILQFKNAGGYLSFKFYGDGVLIKNITLKGNNHEKLAGKATITMGVNGAPVVAMQDDATEEVTLTCDTPVQLGADSEHYVEFWFVLPPMVFSKGFTVTVFLANGETFEKSTSNSIAIERSSLSTMSSIEVEGGTQTVPVPEVIDLGLPSGIKWASFNLGASKPEEYGDYYSWGETEPKSYYYWSTYKWCNGSFVSQTKYNTSRSYGPVVDYKTAMEPEDDAVSMILGGSWHMPSYGEWEELLNNCTAEWITKNGIDGRLLTSKNNGKSIFLPATGYRNCDNLYSAGQDGYYWTSSIDTDIPSDAYYIYFTSDIIHLINYYGSHGRDDGRTIRPVYGEFISITSISLDNSSLELGVGGSAQLSATISPSNATAPSVYWVSSDESIVSVDQGGNLTARAEGSTTVTAYSSNGLGASCSVTVRAITGISLNKESIYLTEGKREKLQAIISPSEATNTTIRWHSSNTDVAVVSSEGEVVAVRLGEAVISVQTEDGVYSSHCEVNVIHLDSGAVDLGLSVKWASCNIGATSPEEYGYYFAWADPNGYVQNENNDGWVLASNHNVTRSFNRETYQASPAYSVISDITPDSGYDSARENWGDGWRMPSTGNFNQLKSNCAFKLISLNGKDGFLFTSQISGYSDKSIFLPIGGGFGAGNWLRDYGDNDSNYWTNHYVINDEPAYFKCGNRGMGCYYGSCWNCSGLNIRAVK